MAVVYLNRAILSLFADPSVQCVIPHLMALPSTAGRDKVFIRFVGDSYPTVFRGQGRSATYALTCRYGPDNSADLLALLVLLNETSPSLSDSRLLLRTHIGLTSGLDVAVAVEVEGDVSRNPLAEAPGSVDVTFTVRVVEHTFAV